MTEPHASEGITSHVSPTAHAEQGITGAPAGHGEHGHGHGASAPPFTPGDWQEFHENDKGAAAVIVMLITSIFIIGLALYSVVAIVVAS